jgi:hypothetical protein
VYENYVIPWWKNNYVMQAGCNTNISWIYLYLKFNEWPDVGHFSLICSWQCSLVNYYYCYLYVQICYLFKMQIVPMLKKISEKSRANLLISWKKIVHIRRASGSWQPCNFITLNFYPIIIFEKWRITQDTVAENFRAIPRVQRKIIVI